MTGRYISVIGLVAIATIAAAQVTPYTSIVAADSAGTVVGPVSASTVTIAVNGRFIAAGITLVGFEGAGKVRFDGPNCTGNAFVAIPPVGFVPTAIVGPPGNSAWIPHPTDTTPRTIAQQSELQGLPDNRGCLVIPLAVPNQVPAIKAAELDLYFTPPFHAAGVGAGCCGDCNGDGTVTINELITGVNAVLNGCH